MTKRVVITGIGIVSSIGNNVEEVHQSLYNGTSGIKHDDEYEQLGFRSHVCGPVNIDPKDYIDRKALRFMASAAIYNYIALQEAINDSGMKESDVSNPQTGIIVGSGGASNENILAAIDLLRNKGAKRIGPYMVPRTMGSTTSANLSTHFKIKGVSYSISSACATSSHCIGNAYELIQSGKQNIIFAGGGEEVHWTMTMLFDGMGALSSKYNNEPMTASRAYDKDRDGFVISGGGGIVVLEELEHALKRKAKIYAEVVGYGATSDGYDMVAPSGDGAIRCMQQAMSTVEDDIDYINAHGTSTPVGDLQEVKAVKAVFGDSVPRISSTKSLTGHALGAAGVNELIYSLIMQQHGYVCASANVFNLDEAFENVPVVVKREDNVNLNTILSNSFGFGGTNASLVVRKFES